MADQRSLKRRSDDTSVKYEYFVPKLGNYQTETTEHRYHGISNKMTPDIHPATFAADSVQRVIKERSILEEYRLNLVRFLEIEPIEDGYTHPAEEILENAWKKYRLVFPEWIQSVYLENFHRPTISAGILRCVGRLRREIVQPWGLVMAIGGLSHVDIEVREAAVRALELWGGSESLYALKTRVESETVTWLADYIREVIQDLAR